MGTPATSRRRTSAPNQRRLVEWIRRHANEQRDEGAFVRVSIRSMSASKRVGDEIQLLPVPGVTEREVDWELTLANHVTTLLQEEADLLGGMQHFACYAIFSRDVEEGSTPVGRCIVSVYGAEEANNDEGIMSEPATAAGLLAGAQRHTEAMTRLMVQSQTTMMDAMRKQVDMLSTRLEQSESHRFDMIETTAAALDATSQRIINERKEAARATAMEEGVTILKGLVPVIANKIVGKPIFPEHMAGLQTLGTSFFRSLTEEQVNAMTSGMTEQQKIQFFSLAESLAEAGEDHKDANGEHKQGES